MGLDIKIFRFGPFLVSSRAQRDRDAAGDIRPQGRAGADPGSQWTQHRLVRGAGVTRGHTVIIMWSHVTQGVGNMREESNATQSFSTAPLPRPEREILKYQ